MLLEPQLLSPEFMPKCLSSIRHLTHCDLSARARKHVLSNKETIVKRKIMLLMRFSCIPTMCVGKKAIIQLKIILWIDYRFRLKSSCSIIPFIFIFLYYRLMAFVAGCECFAVRTLPFLSNRERKTQQKGRSTIANQLLCAICFCQWKCLFNYQM